MFKADNRSSLTDLLRPPGGYVVDAALATTYCLDFAALSAAAAALIDGDISEGVMAPHEFLRAFTRLSDRLVVVVNQGMIDLDHDGRRRRLGGLFDSSIHAAGLDRAVFHPKVWIVCYRRVIGASKPRYRVLCGSRNLTRTAAWEGVCCLDGEPGRARTDFGASLQRFAEDVCTRSGATRLSSVLNMIKALPFVQFGGATDQARFLWQAPSQKSLWKQVPREPSRALLVAPFVSDSFVTKARVILGQRLTLISRQSTLDQLKENRQWCEKNAFVLLPGETIANSHELHAKMLLWESGREGGAWVGSANATEQAWGIGAGSNCEAMVGFSDPKALVKFEKEFMWAAKSRKALQPWLRRYVPAPTPDDTEIQDGLRRYRERLSTLKLEASWRPDAPRSDKGTIALTLRSRSDELPARTGKIRGRRIVCEVGPLLLDPTAPQPPLRLLASLSRGPISWKGFPRTQLSAFARLSVYVPGIAQAREEFLVVCDTSGFPPRWRRSRDLALVQREVDGRPLSVVLLDMLRGYPIAAFGGSVDGSSGKSTARSRSGPAPEGYLELLLNRCAMDSAILQDVSRVLEWFPDKGPDTKALRQMVQQLRDASEG